MSLVFTNRWISSKIFCLKKTKINIFFVSNCITFLSFTFTFYIFKSLLSFANNWTSETAIQYTIVLCWLAALYVVLGYKDQALRIRGQGIESIAIRPKSVIENFLPLYAGFALGHRFRSLWWNMTPKVRKRQNVESRNRSGLGSCRTVQFGFMVWYTGFMSL